MRIAVAVLFTILVACSGDLLACGDKFLVPGRGLRFAPRFVDRASAAVLLYASPGSALSATLNALPIQATLQEAGYRPVVVADRADFERALRAREWDVVVLDLADDPAMHNGAAAVAGATVLPVAHDASRASLEEARKRYRFVLKSPKKQRTFLDAIDHAITARRRAGTTAGARTGV